MVSIIITAYNVAKTIERAINSCLSQSFRDIEVVVIEDCSTDNTLGILSKITDPRVRVIKNSVNVGAGLGRRRGTKEAKGEFTWFLDGDDWLEKDCIETVYKLAVKNKADIVSCGFNIIQDSKFKTVIAHKDRITIGYEMTHTIQNKENATRFLFNKLINSSLWKKVEYSSRRFVEDTQTCFFLLHESNICVTTSYVGYNYWQNPESLCHTSSNIKLAAHKVLAAIDIYNFLFEHNYTSEVMEALYGVVERMRELGKLDITLNDRELYKEQLSEIMVFFLKNMNF